MGLCFSSLSVPHSSSSLNRPQYSGSASTVSKNVGFSEIASGSIDAERSLPLPDGRILKWPNLKVFSYKDLISATKSFKHETWVGGGYGFGTVNKGWLDEKTLIPAKPGSGMVVAIKRFNSEDYQGFREWQNYNAKISDFDLAILDPSKGESFVTTRGSGTYGSAAPEYVATGHLYVKSDVYGFGVVLLEILTGMRALDTNRPTGQQNLVEWTKPLLSTKKKLQTIIDAKIEGQYSPEEALLAAQLTLKCLANDHKQRPSMKDVVETLEAVEAIHEESKESKTRNSHHTSHQPLRQRSEIPHELNI